MLDPLFTTSTIADGNMSLRIGDTQHSVENQEKFLVRHGITVKRNICMECDHGTQITLVHWGTPPLHFGAATQEDMLSSEVLITQEKELSLMLLTADCLPVSLYDPITETIALAHFSRETISKMLPQKTISFLQEHLGINPVNLLIKVGPYIHVDSYSFPLPQPDLSPSIAPFIKKTDTHAQVDLMSAYNHQLTESGVLIKNISVSSIDTATSNNHFSHYQSNKQNDPEGRFATILMM